MVTTPSSEENSLFFFMGGILKQGEGQNRDHPPRFFVRTFTDAGRDAGLLMVRGAMLHREETLSAGLFAFLILLIIFTKSLAEWVGQLRGYPKLYFR